MPLILTVKSLLFPKWQLSRLICWITGGIAPQHLRHVQQTCDVMCTGVLGRPAKCMVALLRHDVRSHEPDNVWCHAQPAPFLIECQERHVALP